MNKKVVQAERDEMARGNLKKLLYKLGIKSAYPVINFNDLFKSVYGDAIKDLVYKDNPLLKLIAK